MGLYEKLVNGEEKLSLVGLGYVGMPIAVAFAKKIKVVGFDLNKEKIALYQAGVDPTNEVGPEVIKKTTVDFTADASRLREARFHIVAVPTPVNEDHTPDLTPVEGASRLLGQNLEKGSVVVFESTLKSVILPNALTRGTKCIVWRQLRKLYPAWTRRHWIRWPKYMNW